MSSRSNREAITRADISNHDVCRNVMNEYADSVLYERASIGGNPEKKREVVIWNRCGVGQSAGRCEASTESWQVGAVQFKKRRESQNMAIAGAANREVGYV